MGLFGPETNTGTNTQGGQEEEDIDERSVHKSIKRCEMNSQRIRNGFAQVS